MRTPVGRSSRAHTDRPRPVCVGRSGIRRREVPGRSAVVVHRLRPRRTGAGARAVHFRVRPRRAGGTPGPRPSLRGSRVGPNDRSSRAPVRAARSVPNRAADRPRPSGDEQSSAYPRFAWAGGKSRTACCRFWMRRSSTLNLADALSERAKLEVIQWLLLSRAPRRALRDTLKALLSPPNMLGPCRLRRARFKPGHKLMGYYDALVRVEGTEGCGARPIAVTWGSDGDADRRQGGGDLAGIQAEALRHGVAAPFRQLTADLPEWSMHVQVSPLDARFPQLVRLSDPRYVRDLLAGAYAADDVAPDQPLAGGYTVTPVSYHPGQRHVLRYDPLDAAKGGAGVPKLYPDEEGARAFRVARRAVDSLLEHGEGGAAARPAGPCV